MRTSLTALALAAGISTALAAEPQQFPATLAGHALLPAATSTAAPADAPADFKVSGKFTAGDGRRIDAVGSVDGTSFLSAKDAPRKTGFKVPLNGQPIQGFSGIKSVGDGSYWVLTDNGFGAKANSSDALLMFHKVKPAWDSGKVEMLATIFLHDPDRKVPFRIVNEATDKRYLTGADFDIESIQPIGSEVWFGDEFGPYLDQRRTPPGRFLPCSRRWSTANPRARPITMRWRRRRCPAEPSPSTCVARAATRVWPPPRTAGSSIPCSKAHVGRREEGLGEAGRARRCCASSSSPSPTANGPAGTGSIPSRSPTTTSATST